MYECVCVCVCYSVDSQPLVVVHGASDVLLFNTN